MSDNRVLTMYLDEVPSELDGLVTESFAQWTIVYNLADRLIEFGPHGELTGNLAESWGQVSGRPGQWAFRLRAGSTFHDGSSVTAEDVVHSLRLAVEDSSGYGSAGHFFGVEDVWAEDQQTVVIRSRVAGKSVLEQLNMNAFAIRKAGSARAVYSGAWKVARRDADCLRLELNPQHPSTGSDCYKSVVIRKIPRQKAEVAALLAGHDHAVLGRSGLQLSANDLPAGARLFSLASGNSHLLSLRDGTAHLEWIRSAVHEIMFSGNVMRQLSHARPLNSFFPPGFVVNAPVLPRKPRRPSEPVSLLISVSPGMAGSDWLTAFRNDLLLYGIEADFVVSETWGVLDSPERDKRDGFIAACYLDVQDPVRLAGHYFTGPRSAVGPLPPLLAGKLTAAAGMEAGLERDRLIRAFYEDVIRDTPCIPLFFSPTVMLASADVSLADLEYYGNTLKFAKIKKGHLPAAAGDGAALDLRMFAHDVKRPFSLIKTAGQLIDAASSVDEIKKISESLLPQMIKAVASVDGMIRDLLKPDDREAAETSDLSSCIEAAIDQAGASWLAATGADKAAHIEYAGLHSAVFVTGDTTSTERIFANLIHNALEAATRGARIWVRQISPESDVAVTDQITMGVGNEGSYIPPDVQQRLFQTGFSRKGAGRGLGLSIVQNLVDKVGGSISVVSSRESGTEFRVTLPVSSAAPAGRMPAVSPVVRSGNVVFGQVVLVEDDPFLADAWEIVWSGRELKVFTCPEDLYAACKEGLLVVDTGTVIVTDYLFEGSAQTGRDVATWARASGAGYVVLASDYDDAGTKSMVDLSIGKDPLSPEQLFRALGGG